MIFSNFVNASEFGLIVDWKRHTNDLWFSAGTKYLINEIIKAFNPIIISSQIDYNLNKRKLSKIISLELGVPVIRFDNRIKATKIIFYSDPHFKPKQRWDYLQENRFDKVLSLYKTPFFLHLPWFPEEKFVHFPWFVPDDVMPEEIELRSHRISIFGGKQEEAYDFRNWCREQPGVVDFTYSGVENKLLSNTEYYDWLSKQDAVICAGSFNDRFNMVTPKYFEVPGMGCLLIGQFCNDMIELGFNEKNCLIFKSKKEFSTAINSYNNDPESFLLLRKTGQQLIKERHLLSHRINQIKKIFDE